MLVIESAKPRATVLVVERGQAPRNGFGDGGGRAPHNGVGDGEGPSPAQHLLVVEGAKPRTAASEMERGRAPRSSVADEGAEPRETNMEWSGRGRAPRIKHEGARTVGPQVARRR